jgi:antitoxin ParD1/3/4
MASSFGLNLIFVTCYFTNIARERKMKLVTVLLPEAYLEGLDELVRSNMYPSRSSVIRSAVRDLLRKELWEKRGR